MNRACHKMIPLLEPYVDGETSAPDRAQVEAHLGACGRCPDVVQTLHGVGASLREAETDAPLTGDEAASFWPGVRARIRAQGGTRAAGRLAAALRAIAAAVRRPILVPALAAFLVLVLGIGYLERRLPARPAVAAQVDSVEGGRFSTVMLFSEGDDKAPVIWIFEDEPEGK
jgi:anti-sigma factor RsiW